MTDFVFNIAKGRINELAALPGTNDALIAVVLDTAALEADAALMDYATLGALLAGASNEHAVMTRQALTGVVVTPDNANNRQGFDADNVMWPTVTGDPFAKLLVCYDPDTTGGADTDIIPLTAHDWVGTPIGTNITAQFNASGIGRAA